MTSVAEMIHTVRVTHLRGGDASRRNTLAVTMGDTTGTSMQLSYDFVQVAPGSRVSIDLEDFHVYETNAATKTLTVERGAYETTASTHAAGDVVELGSNHSSAEVLRTANSVLHELEGQRLYAVSTVELTYDSAIYGYDLTGVTGLLDVIDVEAQATYGDRWDLLDVTAWRLATLAETDDFATGNALILSGPLNVATGYKLRAKVAKSFTPLTSLNQDVETITGLNSADVLALGTAMSLQSNMPMLRNLLDRQPDTRRAAEVPPGAQLSAPNRLARRYEERVAQELRLLELRHPRRMRTR